MNDYRLQMDYQAGDRRHSRAHYLYRFGRDNGWHCGHWHWSLDEASQCLHTPRPVIVEEPPPPPQRISAYIREALA